MYTHCVCYRQDVQDNIANAPLVSLNVSLSSVVPGGFHNSLSLVVLVTVVNYVISCLDNREFGCLSAIVHESI